MEGGVGKGRLNLYNWKRRVKKKKKVKNEIRTKTKRRRSDT